MSVDPSWEYLADILEIVQDSDLTTEAAMAKVRDIIYEWEDWKE